ncbi:MAG: helicase-related protein [bacterium]|nr:helicase-related protein [bacterium]
MTAPDVDAEAVLTDLKDFQRRTARWAFQRMYTAADPATRFLVADEVGLGKTHVAKGVVAQVIDHLRRTGDERHDIVYICSNGAIARQNLRKLAPEGVEPIESVDRLTMLPLVNLNQDNPGRGGVNLLAITPGTSLQFGRGTGKFTERCLAYTFLRAIWGASAMGAPARRVFWHGIRVDPDERLRWWEQYYRPRIQGSLEDFKRLLEETERARRARGARTLRELFDQLVEGLRWQRTFPGDLLGKRWWFIAGVRRIMANVGVAALQPDLVILDEFQRFKDLLRPDPQNFAANVAHRMFNYTDPQTGRTTRTLLLSATPYRMYTTGDEPDSDHYEDFYETCSFLLGDPARTEELRDRFGDLRLALTSADSLGRAEEICVEIQGRLRGVMARTERLAATPDRDGMLHEPEAHVEVKSHDLRAYLRFGDLAESVKHHEPAEYWKSAPYLVNFMEGYKLKETIVSAAADGRLGDGAGLEAGPGLLSWEDVEAYERIDPQNGRLRWLLDDLHRHRAFDLLWIPPSLRYYDTGSVYESPEAATFTKRLIFSGWAVVPKVVSSLASFEAERRAYSGRSHAYTANYGRRGGQRLTLRTSERTTEAARPGEAAGDSRAAAMTTFLLTWPSPTLAELGDPRPLPGDPRRCVSGVPGEVAAADRPVVGGGQAGRRVTDLLAEVKARIAKAIEALVLTAPAEGAVDRRWYWAAPLLLDQQRHPSATHRLLALNDLSHWEGEQVDRGLRAHVAEAKAMLEYSPGPSSGDHCRPSSGSEARPTGEDGRHALGRPPDDLTTVLAELAVGGPAQCALRAIAAVAGLPLDNESAVVHAARAAGAFRSFFNAPEVTGTIVGGSSEESETEEGGGRYWHDVLRHSIIGNLQAVLDEHAHVLRDWLGYLSLGADERRAALAADIAGHLKEALELRTSSFRVDVPRPAQDSRRVEFDARRMRTRFAVAFGNQALEGGGEVRAESLSRAFNSPFWPFVMASTSVGQEGLDFHLWCHAVVHWNLPANPVDLEQREGRVHRYKGHAVRRNIAATFGPDLLTEGRASGGDPWSRLFERAVPERPTDSGEMVPYWVFHAGPAKIERHVPVMPFSRDAAALPKLRKSLAAYRLAFGQPRQEELVEFLGADRSDADLLRLASRLRIDLSPPERGTRPAGDDDLGGGLADEPPPLLGHTTGQQALPAGAAPGPAPTQAHNQPEGSSTPRERLSSPDPWWRRLGTSRPYRSRRRRSS